jgi:IS5 family transposase
MKLKISYRVENWKSYNQALRNRGNLSFWFTDEIFRVERSSKRGRPSEFSDAFIELALTIRHLFHLPLRATQGFLDWVFAAQGIDFTCCDFSLLSKRTAGIAKKIERVLPNIDYVKDLVFDSTGLKVYGEGEWKVRTHGKDKRRKWKKLHLAVDTQTHQIVGHLLTGAKAHDGKKLKPLLRNVKKVGRGYGDGAYDQHQCYQVLAQKGARPVIPPRKNAKPDQIVWTEAEQWRNLNVNACEALGRKEWKVGVGYHHRSLAETHVGRFKQIFTGQMQTQKLANQKAEIAIKVKILNYMAKLGMPDTKTTKTWVP